MSAPSSPPHVSRLVIAALAGASCLTLSACGGEDAPANNAIAAPSPAPSPTPTPQPTPPATNKFAAIEQAIDAYDDTDFMVVFGTVDGEVFAYTKGTFPRTQQRAIASASKWLTGATLMRLVDRGVMSLDDNPQDYLAYWTSDPADPRSQVTLEQLLSFTSGFNQRAGPDNCIENATLTIQICAQQIYQDGPNTAPGAGYSYGSEHMHIAAAMAEVAANRPFGDVFRAEVGTPLGMSEASVFLSPSRVNPNAAGGATSTVDDYILFLQALLREELVADTDLFLADRVQDRPIFFRPQASSDFGDWHYALGAFVECDLPEFAPSCLDDATYSSPGSFGWTPWVDRKNGYWGLVARRGERATAAVAVELQQQLQPLIVEALED